MDNNAAPVLFICITLVILACVDEPDLLDALIHWLMK